MPKSLHTVCGMPIPVSDEEYAEVTGVQVKNLAYNGTGDLPYSATNPTAKTCDLCKRPRDNAHHSLCAICLLPPTTVTVTDTNPLEVRLD